MTPPDRSIHEDPHLLVLDKPAGLLCVPGRGEDKQDCLSARAPAALARRAGGAPARHGHQRPGADGAQPRMQRALGDAFAAQQVHKRYEAMVDGLLAEAATTGR